MGRLLKYGCCFLLVFLPVLLLRAQDQPILLEPSVVSAPMPLVKTVGDTLLFNPAAVPIEEDATLEELLKMIPGLEIEGNTVTLYGRRIEKLLVGGRLFFGGDVLTGLRTLRAEQVEAIGSYERPSDFSRLSGIDDGEGEPVLDVKIKKQYLNALNGRAAAGGGYPANVTASVRAGIMTDTSPVTVVADAHNPLSASSVLNQNTEHIGSGSSGYPFFRSLGADYSLKRKAIDVTAHVKYDGTDRERLRDGWSQTVYAGGTNRFSVARADELSRNDKVTSDAQIEWRPGEGRTYLFRPEFNFSNTLSATDSDASSFRTDPVTDEEAVRLNRTLRRQTSLRSRFDGRMTFQMTQRFAEKRGRNLSFRLQNYLSGGESFNFNDYLALTSKSLVRKQFVSAPWYRNDFTAQLSYNEPLGKGWHVQAVTFVKLIAYNLGRSYYSLDRLPGTEQWTVPQTLSRADWMGSLPEAYETALDTDFSSSGTYLGLLLRGSLSVRYVRKKINTTFGVSVRPTWSFVRYRVADEPDGSKSSFVFYAAPNFTFRYSKSKKEYLSLIYRGDVGTPSPSSLLPVRSGTNPLAVSIGNPDLKPSFIHRLSLTYNYSHPQGGQSLALEASGRLVQNATATSTEYNPETGGRTSRSVNINGNWSVEGSMVYNLSIKHTPLSLSNHLSARAGDEVLLLYSSSLKADERSVLRSAGVKERLDLTARWKKISVTGRFLGAFLSEKSLLRDDFSQMPWMVGGALALKWNLPHRWTLSTDFNPVLSRGNGYPGLDGMYYYWNASVSKGILGGKGIIRLTGNDLLGEDLNCVRRFAASSRSVNRYAAVGRCVLLQLSVKF